MSTPLVSVVIPTYNAAPYLRDALKSVLEQTYRNCEVVVVDDGSTDNSAQIVAEYPSVQYVPQQHRGAAAARNFGIRATTGALIAFLDADDYWMPQKLEQQVRFFAEHPSYGMVFTDHITIDPQGRTLQVTNKRPILDGDIVRNIFLLSNIGTPTVMVRRDVLSTVGSFDETLHCAEDENLWIRIAMDYPVGLIPVPLTIVRRHNDNVSGRPEVVLHWVSKNIERLNERCPRIAQRLRGLPRIRYAELHFSAGLHHLTSDALGAARKEFALAATKAVSLKRVAYWLACFLPLPAFRTARVLRRWLGMTATIFKG